MTTTSTTLTTTTPAHTAPTSPATTAPPTGATVQAVALLDRYLADWGQSVRSLVSATDVVDLALDLRLLLAP
ncbi:MAG: hypothetical protein H8E59_10540 [Actinobacteria bacterium]|nr:hypothetical protein [Actinomycetota bacterium]